MIPKKGRSLIKIVLFVLLFSILPLKIKAPIMCPLLTLLLLDWDEREYQRRFSREQSRSVERR